jgi:hypothetical protein
MRSAVRSVFQAAKADWGVKFTKQFTKTGDPADLTENAWCWRLHDRTKDTRPDCVIDGYERAVREKAPYMPELVDIATATRAVFADSIRNEYAIKQASEPRIPPGSGIAGYVAHLEAQNEGNDIAAGCIEIMREILTRPAPKDADERNTRLDKAISAHEKLMATAPRIRHRGMPKTCPVHDCGKPGQIAMTTHSESTDQVYFCAEHFRNG